MALLALFLLLVPIFVAYYGFVLSMLWGWFIVPLGAPSIGVLQAMGISLVVSFFLAPLQKKLEDDKAWFVAVATPAFFLLLGFILQLFM